MRKIVLISTLTTSMALLAGCASERSGLPVQALGQSAFPLEAQNSLSSTTSPPSPNSNSSSGGAQPTNSLPPGAATATYARPGANIQTTQVGRQARRQPVRARAAAR